ncbi:hypothetical protein AKJ09_04923 [Labilithrix luteola]|uniref:Uncharacterized protein n=1 Tax=Labilithrix luteola TaxID=1391654 RepID=A0A0K1PYP8_9BACT|nr:hypothetical protein [Labilithrix luteola]AKU98259.1 hypothetical protein AKJ09_04923 [Labilithrix luteola]
MALTEEAFTALVDGGCLACQGKKLRVEAVVAQTLPLLGGELYGAPSWAYKGEHLVRGTYRISCEGCKQELFTTGDCPCCDAPGGLERGLASTTSVALPSSCDGCGCELVTATAYVPVDVVYEGKRANKARTQTTADDEGFHAFRLECKECHATSERRQPCPFCST